MDCVSQSLDPTIDSKWNSDPLERNRDLFNANLDGWLSDNKEGMFVLIRESQKVDFFHDELSALKACIEIIGREEFLIQEVASDFHTASIATVRTKI